MLKHLARIGASLKAQSHHAIMSHLPRIGFEDGFYFDETKSDKCPRCKGNGIDPVKNDQTNVCRNYLERGKDGRHRDTGIPVCRRCGGYGTIPKSARAAAFEGRA